MGGESYPITKQEYLYGRRELSHNKTVNMLSSVKPRRKKTSTVLTENTVAVEQVALRVGCSSNPRYTDGSHSQ
jgi:hypothetical protein